MPVKNSILKFQNHYKQLLTPFVVYADFECFTKPLQTCKPNPKDSYTYSYQKNVPSGFCIYLIGLDGINKLFNAIVYTKQSDDEDIAMFWASSISSISS